MDAELLPVIDSELAAQQRGFTGSPTILLDGLDPFAEPGGQPALACRLYGAASGPASVPSLPDLRAAVRRVAGQSRRRQAPDR